MLFLSLFVASTLALNPERLKGIPGLPIGPDSRGNMQCPRSKSPVHAWAKVQTMFKHSCQEVQDEIHARLMHGKTNKGNKWHDPHKNGSYMDLGMGMFQEQYTQIQTERTSGGFPHFHDKQYFTFFPQTAVSSDVRRGGGGGTQENCLVMACSVSQGVSATDGGTNFCNVHDLYCNSMDNCEWVKHDLNYSESHKQTNLGSRDNKWICTGKPFWLEVVEEDQEEIQAII